MIVLGDGTPDDNVVAIICHHLNGRDVSWIVKPEETGLSALKFLKLYVQQFGSKIKTYMFVVDQEELELEELFAEAEKRLKGVGVNLVASERKEKRLHVYTCRIGAVDFGLILVVSGLADIKSSRHSIEDHLVVAGGVDINGDSKVSWMRLDKNQKERVFEILKGSSETVRTVLPQHLLACELLKKDT